MSVNLVDIAQGWAAYIAASPIVQERMKKRLEICNNCDRKEQVDRLTGAVLKVFNTEKKNLFRCGECKCPLVTLASAPGTGCKLKKW